MSTTLGKYSQALEAVGINIKDANGNLKDMDDILIEIGNNTSAVVYERSDTVDDVIDYLESSDDEDDDDEPSTPPSEPIAQKFFYQI